MGQNLNRIPYKDTFWKGTTRTRPRESLLWAGEGLQHKILGLLGSC
jgi:integrin-linked kinase